MSMPDLPNSEFDFESHKQKAVTRYQQLRPKYEEFAEVIRSILKEALNDLHIKVASIEARAKTLDSFGKKAETRSSDDPHIPKYKDPLSEITDLAGVRVITFFLRTVEELDQIIKKQFRIQERTDKADILRQEGRLGYHSVHYLVSLRKDRTDLPEYKKFLGLISEIQVRTILQHTWAEIEHDIQYKSVEVIPEPIRRRFMSLAGLFEIADREFQAIQDEDERLRQVARSSVQEGKLETVEITPDALRTYLDKKLGSDARVSTFSYEWTARLLLRLGFRNFREIDECIAPYDHDHVSRVIWGTRQGQITRFETLLLASMGDCYIEKHPWANLEWFVKRTYEQIEQLKKAGVEIGKCCQSAQ